MERKKVMVVFKLLQYQVKALNFTMVLYEDDSAVWLNSDEELVHEEENEEALWGRNQNLCL